MKPLAKFVCVRITLLVCDHDLVLEYAWGLGWINFIHLGVRIQIRGLYLEPWKLTTDSFGSLVAVFEAGQGSAACSAVGPKDLKDDAPRIDMQVAQTPIRLCSKASSWSVCLHPDFPIKHSGACSRLG